MKFKELKLPGVFCIDAEPFIDERGAFRRHFCEKEFAENGIVNNMKQSNVSENKFAHTLRGFHYQIGEHAEGKTLSCLSGKIFDVVVDLRKDSPTFMQWISLELSAENRKSVHIAPGCANAFLTMEDNCLIHYYCSTSYNPSSERGIRYNDPAFNFEWPTTPKVISDKDLNHPDF
jgi:dTDP-4-dehydrorhamnose 3,5-epimerase